MTPFNSPRESLLNLGHESPLDEPGRPVRVLIKADNAVVLELKNKPLDRSRNEICGQLFNKRKMADEHQVLFAVQCGSNLHHIIQRI